MPVRADTGTPSETNSAVAVLPLYGRVTWPLLTTIFRSGTDLISLLILFFFFLYLLLWGNSFRPVKWSAWNPGHLLIIWFQFIDSIIIMLGLFDQLRWTVFFGRCRNIFRQKWLSSPPRINWPVRLPVCLPVRHLGLQGGPKKWHHFLYALSSLNINRFSKFFYCQNPEKICINTITKDPTTPQVCRYTTLWNVRILKATIENKTTSVTTHLKKLTTGNNVFIVSVIVSKVYSPTVTSAVFTSNVQCVHLAAGRRTQTGDATDQ